MKDKSNISAFGAQHILERSLKSKSEFEDPVFPGNSLLPNKMDSRKRSEKDSHINYLVSPVLHSRRNSTLNKIQFSTKKEKSKFKTLSDQYS